MVYRLILSVPIIVVFSLVTLPQILRSESVAAHDEYASAVGSSELECYFNFARS